MKPAKRGGTLNCLVIKDSIPSLWRHAHQCRSCNNQASFQGRLHPGGFGKAGGGGHFRSRGWVGRWGPECHSEREGWSAPARTHNPEGGGLLCVPGVVEKEATEMRQLPAVQQRSPNSPASRMGTGDPLVDFFLCGWSEHTIPRVMGLFGGAGYVGLAGFENPKQSA